MNGRFRLVLMAGLLASAGRAFAQELPIVAVVASADDGHVPANTLDNSLSTRWSAYGDGQWIRFDLGSEQTVKEVAIAFYRGNERRARFDLQGSLDGLAWSTLFSGQSSGATLAQERFGFPATLARYVRYRGHGNGDNLWNSLTEVDAFTAGSSSVWRPAPGTSWQWQITGVVDTSFNVTMYDIDLFDAVPSTRSYDVPGFGRVEVPRGLNAGVIDQLHAHGRVVICYMDSGAYESYRPDASLFPREVIGNQTYSSGGDPWEGEFWLDIRRPSWDRFKPIIAARMDLARAIGCDGVEPDQNNPLGNDPGFPITAADQKAWYLEIARLAHERGLSVGQKNGIETTDADTVAAFDWNLNEECNLYEECVVLRPFVAAGKAVFQVEYVDEGMTVDEFCPQDNAENFDGLLKRLELDAWRRACR
jgi:hypothetical protein